MPQTIKYILLNGPPQSGKSTIARELTSSLNMMIANGCAISDSLAAPMKHFVATALGEKYDRIPKASPLAELSGDTMRQFLIKLAEDYLKKHYGNDVFARWLVFRSLRYPHLPKFVVVDDLGFPEEVDAVPDPYIIRVERPGYDFQNDSRQYVDGFRNYIHNDGDMANIWARVSQIARELKDQYGH